jgi:hypothetical protein
MILETILCPVNRSGKGPGVDIGSLNAAADWWWPDEPSAGGSYVEYDGVIDADNTVTGTTKVPATGATTPFRATIRCDNR